MNIKATWADRIGRDDFGVYAEINIKCTLLSVCLSELALLGRK